MSEIANIAPKSNHKTPSNVNMTEVEKSRLEKILAETNDQTSPIRQLVDPTVWTRLNSIDKELAVLKGSRMKEPQVHQEIRQEGKDELQPSPGIVDECEEIPTAIQSSATAEENSN